MKLFRILSDAVGIAAAFLFFVVLFMLGFPSSVGYAITQECGTYGWNGFSNPKSWQKLCVETPNADNVMQAPSPECWVLDTQTLTFVYQGTGLGWDRARAATAGDNIAATGLTAIVQYVKGTDNNFYRLITPIGDNTSGAGSPGAAQLIWNGSAWDRQRAANTDNIITGVPAAAMMVFVSSMQSFNRVYAPGSHTDNGTGTASAMVGNLVFNGLGWDRMRGSQTQGVDVGAVAINHTFNYFHDNVASSKTIKSGPGILHTFVVNKGVAGATYTIYDNTSAAGTVIAIMDVGATVDHHHVYDLVFNTGLSVTHTGGPADLTITYK